MSDLISVEHCFMQIQTFLLAVRDLLLRHPPANGANLLLEAVVVTFACVTGGYQGNCPVSETFARHRVAIRLWKVNESERSDAYDMDIPLQIAWGWLYRQGFGCGNNLKEGS